MKIWSILDSLVRFVLFAVAVWLIFYKRRTDRWLITKLERQVFNAGTQSSPSRQVTPIIFPIATSAGLGLIAALLMLITLSTTQTAVAAIFLTATALNCVIPLLAVAALYCHYARLGTRRAKYELSLTTICVAAVVFSSGNMVAIGILFIGNVDGDLESWRQLLILLAVLETLFAIYLIAVQYLAYAAVSYLTARGHLRSFYYYSQSRLLWIFTIFLPYLLAHVLVRFHVVPAMAQRPILFFRSFKSSTTRSVFAEIVAKAARRVGIVEGLVHTSQPASVLHERVDVSEQGHFEHSADVEWQSWVLQRLERASAVVVDIADDSASLTWEIVQAIERLGTSRVALLIPRGATMPVRFDAWYCEYTLERRDVRRARGELRAWLRQNI